MDGLLWKILNNDFRTDNFHTALDSQDLTFKLSDEEAREMTQLLLLRVHQHKGTLSMKKKANNKKEGTGTRGRRKKGCVNIGPHHITNTHSTT